MSAFGFMVIGIIALCCSASCLIAAAVVHVRFRAKKGGPSLRSRQHEQRGQAQGLRKEQRWKRLCLSKASRWSGEGSVPPDKAMDMRCGVTGYGPAVREVSAARQRRQMETGGDAPPVGKVASSSPPVSERATELLCGEEATQFLEGEEEFWRTLDER